MTDDVLPLPNLGKVLGVIEQLHQRVTLLERVLAGLMTEASPEQRRIARKLLDQAVASYEPTIATWPEVASTYDAAMSKIAASYKALFSV